MHDFDVVIVGGGPAGSSAAYAAANTGASVALLEREESIAQSVRTSGVTWISDMDIFGVPKDCYNPIKNYSFFSPNNEVIVRGDVPMAAVLDVRKTYRWLAGQAEAAGAKIFLGTKVTDVMRDGRRTTGVIAGAGQSREEFRAGVVIDASGFQSVVARLMGVAEQWERFGAGAEYEVRAKNVDPDTWHLMVGSRYSPAGYAWIFPLGKETARIGVGIGKPESAIDPVQRLDEIIRDGAGPVGRLENIEILESHHGLIPNDGISRKTAHDGLILAGDSAGQANPLVLEGIRYAIKFGRMAGAVAAGAVQKGDTSGRALYEYEKSWRRDIQSKIDSARKVQDRWIGLSDDQWDEEVAIIGGLSAGELADFIRADFGASNMLRLAAHHPMLAARRLFGMVRGAASRGR